MPDQYYSQNRKVGDGVTTVWEFSFAGARPDVGDGTETYLEADDVLVALADFDEFGVETRTELGAATLVGPAQVEITPAIADGQEFVIYRETLVETPVADFTDFASISEQDLDFSFRQGLFVVQELSDLTQDTRDFALGALVVSGQAVDTTNTFTARVDSLEANVENLLGTGTSVSDLMYKNENLSGLPNNAAARANIGVKSIAEAEQYAQDTANAAISTHVGLADPHTQYAERANNLSDLTSAAAARTNLGLGTAAEQSDSRYNIRTSNLGDVADKSVARENLSVVERTSTLGAAVLPTGTTAQRPAGTAGLFRFNAELQTFEGHNGTGWGGVGGATGAGGNPVFYENDQTITGDYTIPGNKNAMSTGPITIADGVTVTVSDGARWVIL